MDCSIGAFPPLETAAPCPVSEGQMAPPRPKKVAAYQRALRPRRAPGAATVEKSHGRLEIRERWSVPTGELEDYLFLEYGWQHVMQGWLRRWCQRSPEARWTVEEVTVVSSVLVSPSAWLAALRAHWCIENTVHRPRDECMQEDRLHGRAIGVMLAVCRNIVLNLIRYHFPGTFIPTARNTMTVDLHVPLAWMQQP